MKYKKLTIIKLENFGRNELEEIIKSVFKIKNTNVVTILNTQSVAYADSRDGIPILLDDFSEIFGGKAEVVPFEKKYIVRALKKKRSTIVHNKFAMMVSRSLDEAGTMARILEKSAFVYSKVKKYVPLSEFVARLEVKVFMGGYSKLNQEREWSIETTGIDPRPKEERKLNLEKDDKRYTVLTVAKRIYDENRTQGTWGNVSCRIDDKHLYCTPKAIGYDLLELDDIVKMDYLTNTQVGEGNPTSEKGIHCRIMREQKDAMIAIHAHPIYCSIFAARNQVLEVSEENRAILGNYVYCGKHALPMTKTLANNTVDAMRGGKASFMGNHGVAIYGVDVDDAFLVLNTLEAECKKQIQEGR